MGVSIDFIDQLVNIYIVIRMCILKISHIQFHFCSLQEIVQKLSTQLDSLHYKIKFEKKGKIGVFRVNKKRKDETLFNKNDRDY